MNTQTLGTISAYVFGGLCIVSAAPFVGIPFPNSRASSYYSTKNEWLSGLFGGRLSPRQAGYLGAAMRITLGLGLLSHAYRTASCAVMGVIVGYGTVLAIKDRKPLAPQFGMLIATATVFFLNQ